MSRTLKYILIGFAILVLLAIFLFGKNIEFGAIIASITGGIAAMKAKLFGTSSLSEKMAGVETEHSVKREEWQRVKEEYDSKINALKAWMDYLDYKSSKIAQELRDLDDVEKKILEKNRDITDEEILAFLRK